MSHPSVTDPRSLLTVSSVLSYLEVEEDINKFDSPHPTALYMERDATKVKANKSS